MKKWINTNLSQVLDFPVTEDLVSYIMSMENERDLNEYLTSLLDCSNPRHRQFIAELKKQQALYKDQGYKKANNVDEESTKQNGKKKGKVKSKEKRENKQFQENVKIEKVEKKKVKYVNLYSQDGKSETVLLKGRHKCSCEGKRHALINNCLECGRIICLQEGAGPCFFCGNLVCSPKDQTILSHGTKQSDQLYNTLINQKLPKELEDSIKQRDRLLEYDRFGTQGTKVIDDECDYYQTNNMWLSADKREQLKKLEEERNAKRHMSRLDRKVNVTFDFMGREVVEEKPVDEYDEFDEDQLVDISDARFLNEFDGSNVCLDVECSRPIYVESDEPESRVTRSKVSSKIKTIVQDKEYLEMSDLGVCLSMHQPYASLLVAGIKIHEGRTWYSSHRGRLWIAATAKQPTREDISSLEQTYRILKNGWRLITRLRVFMEIQIRFPESYPTSCLLGCVTVTNVLPQEEYRKIYPNGESESPYVFICENFQSLPMKFPISGKHKIYKLDTKIHQAASKMLEKAMKNTS